MHYFDDAADLLPAGPARSAGQLLLDGSEDHLRRPVRQARPEAEALPTGGGGGGRGPRRPRLLEGVRGCPAPGAGGPGTGQDRPARRASSSGSAGTGQDRPARRAGDHPARRAGDHPARRAGDHPARRAEDGQARQAEDRPARRAGDHPARRAEDRRARPAEDRPAWQAEDRPARQAEDRPAHQAEDRPARRAEDRPARQAEDRPSKLPGQLASVYPLKVLDPWSRPPAKDGRSSRPPGRGNRPYRRVGRGLAITPRVSVILPVMNEAANLPGVFATIPEWVDEVVLVDGRSTDDSVEVARKLRPDVRVVLQGGMGKGDALVAGFTAATGDMVIAIDGDGSTDGGEIVRFVSALMSGADFAKGSRFGSAGDSDDITPLRRFGNKVLNRTVNRLFKTSFTDLCYGYNAFWTRHMTSLALDSPGFEVETLMSIRAAEAGLRIYEVPSHERLRQHGASNLSAIKDGWRILRLIVSEKRAAMRRRAQQKRAAKRLKANKPKPFMAPGYLAQHAIARDEPVAAIASSRRSGAGLVSIANGSGWQAHK